MNALVSLVILRMLFRIVPRRILMREEELPESTFAQVAINFGEAVVDQEREDGAEIKRKKVVYIPARPQFRECP